MGMVDKQNIEFPVLTGMHNSLAKQLGILYDQSSARELHGKIGVDLKARNDEDTWEVPIPTTLLCGSDWCGQECVYRGGPYMFFSLIETQDKMLLS